MILILINEYIHYPWIMLRIYFNASGIYNPGALSIFDYKNYQAENNETLITDFKHKQVMINSHIYMVPSYH